MLPVSVKYLIMLRTMVLVTAPPRQIYPVNLLKFQNLFLILSRIRKANQCVFSLVTTNGLRFLKRCYFNFQKIVYYALLMCIYVSMTWHIMEVRGQLVGNVNSGKNSGVSLWWQAPLHNEPSYLPIRVFKTCPGFSFFPFFIFFVNC